MASLYYARKSSVIPAQQPCINGCSSSRTIACLPQILHQQNVKTTPGPPRGVMVPLVLLVHLYPPWSTFSVKFEKVWIRADQSGPGGPRGPQPPLVDQERSGPPWTMLRHFPVASKSIRADQYQRDVNADTLQDVFECIFAPRQHPALDGVPIDCADWKVRTCFPILSAWVADHMENLTLHRLKSNAWPTREVPPRESGTNIKNYRARDYAGDERYGYEN